MIARKCQIPVDGVRAWTERVREESLPGFEVKTKIHDELFMVEGSLVV